MLRRQAGRKPNARTGVIRRRLSGEHEYPDADNRSYAKHYQINRSQRTLQAVPAYPWRSRADHSSVWFGKDQAGHSLSIPEHCSTELHNQRRRPWTKLV